MTFDEPTYMDVDCKICNGKADEMFRRIEVWRNKHWRLTASTYRLVRGFCYLEPIRHIRYITELDGEEAVDFGQVLSRTASSLKTVTNASHIYVYIYGDHIPHLHVHLAPHSDQDLYVNNVVNDENSVANAGYSDIETRSFAVSLSMELSQKFSSG